MKFKAAVGALTLVVIPGAPAWSQDKPAPPTSPAAQTSPPVPAAPKRSASAPQPRADEPCPDQKTYTGKYRNWVYGFSIVIPAGLKGYWNSARCAPDERLGCVCMGDHGRFIPLADDASVEAFVGYEMEDGWSARDYEKEEVSDLRRKQGVARVEVLDSKWTRLGRLRARRFVVRFDEKGKEALIDHIIALHDGVEYELILRTSPERYGRDRRQFEKVLASWRLTPRD